MFKNHNSLPRTWLGYASDEGGSTGVQRVSEWMTGLDGRQLQASLFFVMV